MKKTGFILLVFIGLLLVSCSPDTVPILGGSYQSEHIEGYVVQIVIQPDDNTFVEYIDNREVDRGIFEKKSDNTYLLRSDKQTFVITLYPEDSFKISINQINGEEPIELKNINKVPIYISTEFEDVEEYEKLLNEK